MSNDPPVQVYEAANSMEAALIKQLLAEVGIKARIASSAIESISGEVPFQRAVVPIWVHESDSDRALAELSRFAARRRESRRQETEEP